MRVFLLSLLACAAAQATLLGAIGVNDVRPDLFLLLVIFLSPRVTPEVATIQGFIIGLCQDALSGSPLGLRAFSYTFLAFMTARLSHDFSTEKPLTQFWLLLAGAAGVGVLTLALLTFFVGVPPLLPAVRVMAPEVIYTVLFGFLLLRVPWMRGALRGKI
jgi:rod shape-determining protein MreD